MKNILTIPCLLLCLLSCNQQPEAKKDPDTPTALQDKNSSSESIGFSKGRSAEDLVERLYKELVDKTAALKELESKIDDLNAMKIDSTQQFNTFNEKNTSYYSAADQHAALITDSSLKDRLKAMVASRLSNYNRLIAGHKNLVAILDSKDVKVHDLHIVLKLVKTLPLIEKFQKDDIPNTNPLNHAINEYDKTLQKLDSLTNH